MPLVESKFTLASKPGKVMVTYATTHRTAPPPGVIEPLFVMAPVLDLDLGNGPIKYGPSEFSVSQIANPALTAITVSIEKTVDAGGKAFTVFFPAPTLQEGKTQAKAEAVAFETQIRTFLANVGQRFPAEEFRVHVLRGTYSESEISPGAG